MPMSLTGFGAFTPAAGGSLLDGSESDGTQLLDGNAGMTSDWFTAEATRTDAAAVAPDGTTTACSLIENSAGNRHIVYAAKPGLTADATFRFSVYAKSTGRRYLQLHLTDANGDARALAYFDLQSPGAVTDTELVGDAQSVSNATITAAANDFYKCSVDVRLGADDTYLLPQFSLSDVSTYGSPLVGHSPSYTGDGTSGVFLWRPKLVQL